MSYEPTKHTFRLLKAVLDMAEFDDEDIADAAVELIDAADKELTEEKWEEGETVLDLGTKLEAMMMVAEPEKIDEAVNHNGSGSAE